MPHITEGLLHAHLDGAPGPDEQLQWAEAEAHLEVCDDCRRRRAEAVELRDAARDLLAGAAPSGSATRPAFDELVSRARARRASASGRRSSASAGGAWWRTPATLGWAASLVIAAGAGWIGRQLVVEQRLAALPMAAEQDARVPPPPAAPETAAPLRAEAEPRQGRQSEPEELQEKAQAREDANAEDAVSAGALGMQDMAPRSVGPEAANGARCYVAPPAADDGRERLTGKPEALRLAPDGTASLRFDGRPMVGFWERAAADSLRLRVTDGGAWRELGLVEVEDGVRGDADLDTADCP